MPAGETYVWRRLARMRTVGCEWGWVGSEWAWGKSWEMMPMPSLFAEPSRPREMGMVVWGVVVMCVLHGRGLTIIRQYLYMELISIRETVDSNPVVNT